jgi:hypothetical protein
LKCDRGQPCSTCSHRGLSLSCTYATSSVPAGHIPAAKAKVGTHPLDTNLHDRIEQLEKLVLALASSNSTPTADKLSLHVPDDRSASTSSPEDLASNLGRINIDDEQTSYVESTHWTSILDGITELKVYLDTQSYQDSDSSAESTQDAIKPSLLLPTEHRYRKQDILGAIPPKPIVDRLVARCFTHAEVLHLLLHAPTFQKQYENFWKQPNSTPILWIGTLFGLMCIAVHLEYYTMPVTTAGSAPMLPMISQHQIELYRRKMIQCLMLGGYAKGGPHAMETLLLYFHVEFSASPRDLPTELWLLLGVIIRLALRLGYHRDGSHFPSITPFEAEMRRRRWCSILQLETMASSQYALPKMIHFPQVDVQPPHNLFDEDFDESTEKLPESWPDTTVTPSLYIITKVTLFQVFGQATELNLQPKPPSYAQVTLLDKTLDELREKMPARFIWRSMAQSVTDKPELVFQRIWLHLLYLKTKTMMHRRYIRVGRGDKRCNYSRVTCINSALQILDLQRTVFDETQLNGRLYHERWRQAPLMKQEYLIALAILCVDVYTDLDLELSPADPIYPVDRETRARVISALNTAQSIWHQESADSKEAKKATRVLQLVLEKAKKVEATKNVGSRPQWKFDAGPVDNNLTASHWPSFAPTSTASSDEWTHVDSMASMDPSELVSNQNNMLTF